MLCRTGPCDGSRGARCLLEHRDAELHEGPVAWQVVRKREGVLVYGVAQACGKGQGARITRGVTHATQMTRAGGERIHNNISWKERITEGTGGNDGLETGGMEGPRPHD